MEKGAAHTRRPLRHGGRWTSRSRELAGQELGVVPSSVDCVDGVTGCDGTLLVDVLPVVVDDAGEPLDALAAVVGVAFAAAGFAAGLAFAVAGFLLAGFFADGLVTLVPRSSATTFSPRTASSSYSFSALTPSSLACLRSWVGSSLTCSCTWANVGSALTCSCTCAGRPATAAGTSVLTRVGSVLTRVGNVLTRSRIRSMATSPAPTEARNGLASSPGSAGRLGRVLMVGRLGIAFLPNSRTCGAPHLVARGARHGPLLRWVGRRRARRPPSPRSQQTVRLPRSPAESCRRSRAAPASAA